METVQPPLSPLPPSFQPSRTRSHRLSLGSRNSFSSSSFSSPASFGAGLLRPPPAAHLADKQRNRRVANGLSRKMKGVGSVVATGGGGPKRESWLRHGHGSDKENRLNLMSDNSTTMGSLPTYVGAAILGEPINLDAALSRRSLAPLSATVSLELPPLTGLSSSAQDRLSPSSTPAISLPVASSLPSSNLESLDFGTSSLSNGFGSSRRHSRLGMLKHRTKSLASGGNSIVDIANPPSSLESQRPRSPSIDITSAFHSLADADNDASSTKKLSNGGDDAFELFEEAFPYPSSTIDTTPRSPSLVALLAPSLASPPAPTAKPQANASIEAAAQAMVDSTVSSSTPKTKGLRELELVKRRMSWESVSSSLSAETVVEHVVDATIGGQAELSDEEKFEDAIEEDVLAPLHEDLKTSSTSMSPSLSPIRRSSFPSTSVSPISLDTSHSSLGLGLGLGLGIELVEPEQPMSTSHSQLQALSFDELREGSDSIDVVPKGLGIGLGPAMMDAMDDVEEEIETGIGLGLDFDFGKEMKEQVESVNEKRTLDEDLDRYEANLEETHRQVEDFQDPPTPLLEMITTPILPSSPKTISPRRQPRSPPRAKKVSRPLLLNLPSLSKAMKSKLPAQVKRIYPRMQEAELGRKIKEAKLKSLQGMNATQSAPEDVYYGSPNLSDLPGSFLASPVLPTSFADFGHSPLPTPPQRFARMRRGGQQTAPLPDYAVIHAATLSPVLPTTTPGIGQQGAPSAYSTSSVYCPPSSTIAVPFASSLPGSPMGTPTLAASPAFSPSPSDMSAPSTPIPDQVIQNSAATPFSSDTAGTAAGAAAASHTGEMNQQLFDAAIASTILGAIVCIGAVSWLALAVFKKKLPGSQKKGYSTRGIGSDDAKRFSDDLDDEKIRASPMSTPSSGGGAGRGGGIAARGISAPVLTDLPKPPPLARLSFPPGNTAGGSPPERSFSSHFDAWVDASTRRALAGASTEDHGGYPEEAVRGDGMSTVERRMSRASRMSTQSFGSRYPRSNNRSSYRSSTGPSLIDSTWSTRPGTTYSSRTSHHDPKDYAVASTPPQLPSPILRNSIDASDVAAYFASLADTPTRPHRSYFADNEPPVPSLPSDFRDLPSTAPAAPRTRARASSKSNGSKSTTSKPGFKSTMKTMPALNTIITPDEGHESPTEAALRKLEKRRATVDGGILADGLQALLFQAHLDSPTKGISDSNTEEKPDIFSTSIGGNGSAQIKRNSITSSGSSSGGVKHSTKSPKKTRPQTMPHLPPTIVVSDHPTAVAPPTPVRNRTVTADSEVKVDARASIKTNYENLPWLAHSPSSNFSVHPRDDAGSVIDPEMRSIRHFSVDTNRFSVDSMPAPPKRFSQDFAARSPHAPLDSIDIASRRLASEDDLASQGSIHEQEGGNDTDEEEARRTQRRKTLLYSVYKQRGVDLSPSSVTTATASGTSPNSSTTLSRTSLSEDSTVDTPTKGAARDALVASFPSPPPLPDAPAFASLVANLEQTMDAAASLAGERTSTLAGRSGSSDSVKAMGRSRTATTVRELDIGTVKYKPEEEPRFVSKNSTRVPVPPQASTFAPPRPPKSPIRMSILPDAVTTSPSSRIPLPSRQPARQPFAPVNGNSLKNPSSSSSTAVSKPTTVSAPPVRSFAAELQESVGNPAEGYDSDTLMSGLAFNKPGRSFFSGNSSTASGGGFSNSSSGYGFASGMYSTNPGSMESLEEVVAITQAETVQFGRSRASGIPQFSWRRNNGVASSGIGQYDSEESAYEESDAETAMFRARERMDPIAE